MRHTGVLPELPAGGRVSSIDTGCKTWEQGVGAGTACGSRGATCPEYETARVLVSVFGFAKRPEVSVGYAKKEERINRSEPVDGSSFVEPLNAPLISERVTRHRRHCLPEAEITRGPRPTAEPTPDSTIQFDNRARNLHRTETITSATRTRRPNGLTGASRTSNHYYGKLYLIAQTPQ